EERSVISMDAGGRAMQEQLPRTQLPVIRRFGQRADLLQSVGAQPSARKEAIDLLDQLTFEVVNVHSAGPEAFIAYQLLLQVNVGFYAFYDQFVQRDTHLIQGGFTRIAVGDQLADH